MGRAVDIGRVLDAGPWTARQRFVVLLAAFAVLLDGFDSQLLSFAIPVLVKEWGVTRGAFAPVVASGLVGMALGSVTAGIVGDRLGRRTAMLGSVLVFAVATGAIGFADDLATLGLLRFVAGLGIGGALPTATTLTAEFTPARNRTLAVTLTIVCVPLGGMLAGLFAGRVLPGYGWRTLFFVGGALPLAFLAALAVLLPESPRFLARHERRWPELVRLLARMARPVDATATFVDPSDAVAAETAGFKTLFRPALRRDTIALWAAFFLCLLSVYSAFSWLPALLSAQGLDVATAASGLTAYNLGGTLGSLACAWAIARFGSRRPQVFCALGAAASAVFLAGIDPRSTAALTFGLGLHGLFVNGIQSTLYAVAARVYPTGIRARGTAAALAFGRLGAILSAFSGASLIASAGTGRFFTVLAACMAGAAIALVLLRNPIPPPAADRP